jgi:hypothetical protein
VPIDRAVAAEVLFESDRTCCVCRERGKRLQIHHIDEDNANNDRENLVGLCFDCHDEMQVRGGFGRQLDAVQVRRYRDDWENRVRRRRDDADRLFTEAMSAVPRTVQASDALEVVAVEAVGISEETSAAIGVGQSSIRSGVRIHDYVRTLPELRQRAYEQARPEWDTGVTARMVEASYRVIDVLQEVLTFLAAYYPPGHFDRENPKDYISELIATRFRWQRYRHEPDGAGQNGTIVHTLVAGSVMADVGQMIVEMVGSLTLDWADAGSGDFSFESWKADWEQGAYVDPRGLLRSDDGK